MMGRPKGSRNIKPMTEEKRERYRRGAAGRPDAWSAAHLIIVADMSLTADDVAAQTGRTKQAVHDKRHNMGWLGAARKPLVPRICEHPRCNGYHGHGRPRKDTCPSVSEAASRRYREDAEFGVAERRRVRAYYRQTGYIVGVNRRVDAQVGPFAEGLVDRMVG